MHQQASGFVVIVNTNYGILSSIRSTTTFLKPSLQPYSISRRKAPTTASTSLSASSPKIPNFCSDCGSSQMKIQTPDGDDHLRAVCQDCGAVVYENPKVVVSCVILVGSANDEESPPPKVLLAKRAIEPRRGYWGIPQGYMELEETTRQAVCRETLEETGTVIKDDQLSFRAFYNVPGSVQLVYSMSIQSQEELTIATSTKESTEIGFHPIDELPELCFPTVQWAIDHCCTTTQSAKIQQKNKLYDSESGIWSESEDIDAPLL